MRNPFVFLVLVLVLLVIMVPVFAAETTSSQENKITQTTRATQIQRQNTDAIVAVTTVRTGTRSTPGEVVIPITPRVTVPPTVFERVTERVTETIPRTTATPPPTVSSTPPPVTQTTPVPVVTVTVLVYPSGPVYNPYYPYPYGYPYPIDYYNPAGSLTVMSNPSGAVVYIDGYNYGTTPYTFTGLTTGYHTVEVNYPGYEAYITNVYMDTGASQQVYADLSSLVSAGSLVIDSTPRGADVYVDGNYQGTSPVTVSGVVAGSHQIELHLAGYEVLTSTQSVSSGQGTVVSLVMVPYSATSGTGSIDVTSTIPGALVYLDGIYKGSIQSGTVFSVIAVSPGSHTILLHVPGYADFTQSLQIQAGQIAHADAIFTAATAGLQGAVPAATGTGSIIVTSVPSGGQVSVDNLFRGVAPVTIYNVAPGTHIVNIRLNGYSDWSGSVDVPANQMVQVPATLAPGGAALPASTRAGLSGLASIGALAIAMMVLAARFRR